MKNQKIGWIGMGIFSIFTCSLALASIDPSLSNKRSSKEATKAPQDSYPLTKVLRVKLTGLDLESASAQTQAKQQAVFFSKLKKGKLKKAEKFRFLRECDEKPYSNPYCWVKEEPSSVNLELSRDDLSPKHWRKKTPSRELMTWITQGKLERLRTVSLRDVKEGLHSIDSIQQLNLLSEKIGKEGTCEDASLFVTLGSKVEEFFPDQVAKNTAIQLYERMSTCSEREESTRAEFRLSLLHIWDDHCNLALPYLRNLASRSLSSDLGPRVLFWKIQCEDPAQGAAEIAKDQNTLLSKYPLSLHALLASKETQSHPEQIMSSDDVQVRFRVEEKPSLNLKMRSIEALIEIQELALAKQLLDKVVKTLDREEDEFRLYVAVLYTRVQDYLKNFRVLTALFRDNPKFITRATLELYYPKDSVQTQIGPPSKLVNGTLLLSLIRQESGFNSKARSSAGALGLMQLLPQTARRFEKFYHHDRLYDPSFNLKVGSRYMQNLLTRYDGDVELALAAYNAGPGRIDSWKKRYTVKNRALFLDLIPFKETREYVSSIARNYFWYSALYSDERFVKVSTKTKGPYALQAFGSLFRSLGT